MSTATVCRIRPIAWKVTVQGKSAADHVRDVLEKAGAECSASQQEPELQQPPLFAFTVKLKSDAPFTDVELQALLEHDENIDLAFDRQ